MARLLRALAALLLLAAAAVADDGWFPADFPCFGLVPAEVLLPGGGFRAARESRLLGFRGRPRVLALARARARGRAVLLFY